MRFLAFSATIMARLAFAGLLCALPAKVLFAHGGGLDAQGGHNDRRKGTYHCHREPCFTIRANASAPELQASSTPSYQREDWLNRWPDLDGNCRDERDELLTELSEGLVTYSDRRGCNVLTGLWYDPYSGTYWTLAADVDIDHLVPLAEAHRSGGAGWSRARKREFALDPANLVITHEDVNRSKSDSDPADWLPPSPSYWCTYSGRWRAVKRKYGLAADDREERALSELSLTCGDP